MGTYLFEFLKDPRVIDLPKIVIWFLVNLLIIPFRMFSSAREYSKLWTDKGSPLLFHSLSLQKKLQNKLGDSYRVHLVMRYNTPSIHSVFREMENNQYDEIIILPLYPQYASSSNGTAIEKVLKIISKWWLIPNLKVVSEFYQGQGYIQSIKARANEFDLASYDHVLISFHGLPIRHVNKVHLNGSDCESSNCMNEVNTKNKYCYLANSYETARLMASELGLNKKDYRVCFQSRLDDKWLKPYTDKEIIKRAKKGEKNILVFFPAFVSDCLETSVEIGEGFQELFKENGGNNSDLVPSLNDHPVWVDCISNLVVKHQSN